MTKIRVAVLFGGTNSEHEVSLVSAKAVIDNLDRSKYEVVPIKITKENTWVTPKEISTSYIPQLGSGLASIQESFGTVTTFLKSNPIDVVFPVLHGPYGEDGTIQGMLEIMRVPYVGCGVASSAVCMDKVLQKNICTAYGIPIVPYYWVTKGEWESKKDWIFQNIRSKFDDTYPLFVKPANQGSSIGITKAHNESELMSGIDEAFTRDLKILVEMAVPQAREIECSVVGPRNSPEISVLGEIVPGNEFYDYNAKYIDDNSQAIIPADLPEIVSTKMMSTARLAFQALDCWGLVRVDFLLNRQTNEFYVCEVNTMPGFTPISMFPKLWLASGLKYQDLLTRLIDLALERHHQKSSINLDK